MRPARAFTNADMRPVIEAVRVAKFNDHMQVSDGRHLP